MLMTNFRAFRNTFTLDVLNVHLKINIFFPILSAAFNSNAPGLYHKTLSIKLSENKKVYAIIVFHCFSC